MTAQQEIKAFWDEQARAHLDSSIATNPDPNYRELEIAHILPHLSDHGRILDVGCGNGYSTLRFARANPHAIVLGVDYSIPMIRAAMDSHTRHHHSLKNVSFLAADVLSLTDLRMQFDIIVTERCLINLPNFTEQKKAILEMKRCLNYGGKLVLVENTMEGLANLNTMRRKFDLPDIKMRWHNQYLPQQEFLKFARQHFQVQTVDNIGNLYYMLSRVVYAKLCQDKGELPDYNHPINQIAAQLPSFPAYRWSPNYLFVLRNS